MARARSTPKVVLFEGTAALGAEVRALRKARGMTLSELARASGVSVSHLSAIERGAVNASSGKIGSIADALAVPAAWFRASRVGAGPLEREHVVRAQNRRDLNMVYGEAPEVLGYRDWLLSSSVGGAFYMGLSEFPPRSAPPDDGLYVHAGEQHLVVIEGELVLKLMSAEVILCVGDSYSIPGNLPHRTLNRSGATARAIWATAPVILPVQLRRKYPTPAGEDSTRAGAQASGT